MNRNMKAFEACSLPMIHMICVHHVRKKEHRTECTRGYNSVYCSSWDNIICDLYAELPTLTVYNVRKLHSLYNFRIRRQICMIFNETPHFCMIQFVCKPSTVNSTAISEVTNESECNVLDLINTHNRLAYSSALGGSLPHLKASFRPPTFSQNLPLSIKI